MIISLHGHIVKYLPFFVHLEVGGVGYGVKTPLNVSEFISEKVNLGESQNEKKIFLFTRVIYREDSQTIYGFLFENEALLFDFLCELSGIGPAIAMNIISTLGSDNVFTALLDERLELLTRVPKVGKAKAEKIIFESKNRKKKLTELKNLLIESVNPESNHKKIELIQQEQDVTQIVEDALVSLGYSKKEIDLAALKLQKQKPKEFLAQMEVQEQIKLFLSQL